MQAYAEVDDPKKARQLWLQARESALVYAEDMVKVGLHKQVIARILEPWTWTTEIVSSTQWSNFFALRCHHAAEPHAQKIAELMRAAYEASTPTQLKPGEWHLPFGHSPKVDTGLCAMVSYLNDDVERAGPLHDKLAENGHWSPFEHCAAFEPLSPAHKGGNFGQGWLQYRKAFQGECK